jgi:hypothetical protein
MAKNCLFCSTIPFAKLVLINRDSDCRWYQGSPVQEQWQMRKSCSVMTVVQVNDVLVLNESGFYIRRFLVKR